MNRADLSEDVSFLLYLLPLIVSGLVVAMGSIGASSYNLDVFLAVTRDPIIFSVSILSVSVGTLFEVYSTPPDQRGAKIGVNARRMQKLAVATILISAIAAWVSLGAAASFPLFFGSFLTARFPILFAVFLILLSSGLETPLQLPPPGTTVIANTVSIVSFLLAPFSLYLGSTIGLPFTLTAAVSTFFVIVGLGLFAYANRSELKTKPKAMSPI